MKFEKFLIIFLCISIAINAILTCVIVDLNNKNERLTYERDVFVFAYEVDKLQDKTNQTRDTLDFYISEGGDICEVELSRRKVKIANMKTALDSALVAVESQQTNILKRQKEYEK